MTMLLTDKYRPKTLDEYVWTDPRMRAKFEEHLAAGVLPHLLLSGPTGTGKTSLAYLMLLLLGIPSGDILFIKASSARKIDEIQTKIENFCSTWSLNDTGFKYVILDEADAMSPLTQKFLRGETEGNSSHCRFIMTCNYPDKIIPALKGGRTQHYVLDKMERDEFIARAGEILTRENIEFDVENLLAYCDLTYPDLRKCLSTMDKETVGGVLGPCPSKESKVDGAEYLLDMVELFKAGRFKEARTLVTEKAQIEEYQNIYRYFYTNMHLWGSTEDQQDEALLIIRRALVNHAVVADPEINLAACMVELIRVIKS